MSYNIIPIPKLIKKTNGEFLLSGEIAIMGELEAFNRDYIIRILEENTSLFINRLSDRKLIFLMDEHLCDEEYSLIITEREIKIISRNKKGQFYGINTLMQLFPGNKVVDCLEIYDKPRYRHRGILIDVCRHFIPKDEILRFIEISAIYKLNCLHLHISDDQGWRIYIEKYPKLTEIGSKRTTSTTKDYNENTSEYKNSGFFTKEDIKEIISYAVDRNIEVIPEIDMPGHFTAAIASYNELLCKPKETLVSTKCGIHRDIVCVGKKENYKFIFDVLEEVFELFPSENIHLGGDEVIKTNWINCRKCMEVVRKNNLENPQQLQTYFMNKIIDFVKKKGKKVILWNDAFTDNTLDKLAICQFWNAFGKTKEIQQIIKSNNYEVIDSNYSSYYFDYPISVTSLKTAYNYESIFEGGGYKLKGMEMALWTESIHSKKIANERLFPRMFAFAENSWSPKESKSYYEFRRRVIGSEALFKKYGITLTNRKKWECTGLRCKIELFKQIRKMFSKDIFMQMTEMKRINKIKFKS